mgnify:CR=1 FL=1
MTIRLGVIADDFTGATDIAGFLVANGLAAVQINGVPTGALPDTDAVVVSLKSRSIDPAEAVEMSLAALAALQRAGAERILFKYCSTFDSTPSGNIGPVTDALMDALGADLTVICPSLPVNGRTVYQGHLFVGDTLLSESGMRHHPVTPMTDPNLLRVMEAQSTGKAGLVALAVIQQGPDAIRSALDALRADGVRYAVLDTVADTDLTAIGQAVDDLALTTGGSGLGGAVARALTGTTGHDGPAWRPVEGRTVVLSGSCSVRTNEQVADYRDRAPSLTVDVERLVADPEGYRAEVLAWVLEQPASPAPMVYATAGPDAVRRLQEAFGAAEVSEAVESLFGWLARELADAGVRRFVVAGGETSGSVTTALGVDGFHVGPQIAPGVPWVRSLDDTTELALKSGNFGDVDFFTRAQA